MDYVLVLVLGFVIGFMANAEIRITKKADDKDAT